MSRNHNRKIVLTNSNCKQTGKFVYHVQAGGVSKIGKHNGPLTKLIGKYIGFYPPVEISIYDCDGYDSTEVKNTMLLAFDMAKLTVEQDFVKSGYRNFFETTVESYFDVSNCLL